LAAICGATDILLFIPVREVPRASTAKPPTPADILVTPWKNTLFRGFALYTIVSWIAYMMMGPFVWRYCFDPVKKHGLGMSVMEAHVLLTIVPLVAMAWVAPCWGRAIDRFGPKPVLACSALFAIVMPFTWVMVHPGMEWIVWVAAVVSGLTWPGIDQVNFYMTVKGFPDARRTTYVAAYQVMMGVANMAGSALGGVCATFWQHQMHALSFLPGWVSHYQLVFLTAIGLRLAAFLFIFPWMKLQGDANYGTVARAIANDLTATLPSGVGTRKWRRNAPER
ncbi:MAG TPA: MFS transporter, partial [Armatimonadota bacterium]|nr:MFS transporter [Armatimonadota bacterium]